MFQKRIVPVMALTVLALGVGFTLAQPKVTKETKAPAEAKVTKETKAPAEAKGTKETKAPAEAKGTKETKETKAPAETKEAKGTKAPDRAPDKLAIEKLIKANIEAFNKHDAAAIAADWTDEGEYIRNDGEPIHGKADIQKGYAEYFKTLKDKIAVEVQTDNLRFTSADTALMEVTVRAKNEQGQVTASSWRHVLAVREGGQWKVARVQEWDRDNYLDDSLKDLEWLIGTWRTETKDGNLTTTYEWDENKAFIRSKYTNKHADKVVESGTQFLGLDSAEGGIRSWTFQSDGGFGDGLWTRDGKHWSVDFGGVSADGKKLSAIVNYVRVDADTFTWQAIQQTVDGQPIADSPPLKVTRQKSSK